ncbi:integrin alpha-M isoform X3 [Mus caroli]|uniref:Integrin alpha-M isoform X3 n=1 Tax=Mus caroli TaxID=10089 RepID=A0A6P5Q825_MUSCR|nr:integrin alpha-M isoform X3 [Mus caroli]
MTLKVLLVTVLALCHGFNLDTEHPMTFHENARGFGQSVVQLGGTSVVVAAPQEAKAVNQTGALYQCDYSTSRCDPIPLQVPPEAVNMSLGLSLAVSTVPQQLLACGPTVHQNCKENTYVNGLCYLFGSNLLRPPQQFPEALRECPQQESDIVFLIDGSGSINNIDFQKMKEFVSTVMEQFKKSKTLFSLMQYSDEFRIHFTFNDFKRNPSPRSHVSPIKQLKGWTQTASGIQKVVRELFHKTNGARENAAKILVVITDGEKYGDPLDYKDVIPEADRAGVIRYVIGVGNAFNKPQSRRELDTIASKPAGEHVFQVDNFEALNTIQNQLQEKIFAIEGTQTGSTSSFEHEMSQEGFSAAITSNGPLLGSVGSFDWAGGAFLYTSKDKATFINTTRVDSDMNDAYLGYASVVILRNRVQSLVLGAPRYQHIGLVVMFRENFGTWEPHTSIKGSQRIIGSHVSPGLQYFGQSLSGGKDLTMDGLMDLAVGAQGHLLLLRAQPVLRLEATMEFSPKKVARSVFVCQEQVLKNKDAGEVRVCLRVRKNTKDRLREGDIRSTVTYDLALDPGRPRIRAFFDETKNSTRRRIQVFGLMPKCETLKLILPDCVEDSVSPIILRLNYTLVGEPLRSFGNLRPVLAVDAQRFFTAMFPFEKNCGNDSICQDDLSITMSAMGLDTLVVGGPQDFNLSVTLRNDGEDSYGTQVTVYYPSGLSYRKDSASQNPLTKKPWFVKPAESSSSEGHGALKSTTWNINHPIFPANSEVTFNVTFDVDSHASFGNKLLLKAIVASENNMSKTHKTEFQLELPVKYAIYMIVTSDESSIRYLNFTASEMTSKVIQHQYQFNNLGQRSLPVSVVFWIPVQINNVTIWDHPQVIFSQNLSNACHTEQKFPSHSNFRDQLERTPVLNCSVAVCKRMQCDLPSFNTQEIFNVTLKGNLSFDWYIKTSHGHLLLVSSAEILFNDSAFALLPGQESYVRSKTETKVEPYEVHNPVPLIVGSSIGGLVLLALITAGLYKLGFFKRQYKDMMNEAAPQDAPPQ